MLSQLWANLELVSLGVHLSVPDERTACHLAGC